MINDNNKFKKFFGFGDGEQESVDNGADQMLTDKEVLQKAEAHIGEWAEKYLTLTADFENFKKRVSSERADWATEAQRRIILDLLDVVDNFERALEQEKKREASQDSSWLAGFEMIYQSLEKLLTKYGVQPITDFSVFNPKYHEALMSVASDTHQSGDIVQVLQKGYLMNDKVIRPATVSVAQ